MTCDYEFDGTAFSCPLLLTHTKKEIEKIPAGKILKIITKDPSAVIDFKTYTSITKHTLLTYEKKEELFYFYIKKGN